METPVGRSPVRLQPFVHQVAGHASMLRFDDSSVCKPLVVRECKFYESMPADLQQFVPQYKGVISVSFQKTLGGEIEPIAHCPDVDNHLCHVPSQMLRPQPTQNECDNRPLKKREEREENVHMTTCNPWSQRLARRCCSQQSNQFLLLENLTSQYGKPCILDLKMGTRQHGDDAVETKRVSQMTKCANTTSGTLGFRVCGMQVYQTDTERYLCHSKYHGRRLSTDDVRVALRQFLHDGRRVRVELVPPVVARLLALRDVIERLSGFRFYSSSLLIMYDGMSDDASGNDSGVYLAGSSSDDVVEDCTPAIDVRMIDFAHATCEGFLCDKTLHEGPDHGYLLGLQSLVKLFRSIEKDG